MPADLPPPLLDLLRKPLRHLWIGTHPPAGSAAADPKPADNYRLPPTCHRSADVVWATERELGLLPAGALPLVLDELLRCLGEDGRLVLRYTENDDLTVVALKRFLGRHPFAAVSVEFEDARRPGGWLTVFRVRRSHLAEYAGTAWTLAVLTRGKKVGNVVRFLQSAREQDPDHRHELIVCGPGSREYEPFGVRLHDRPYSADFGDIGTKKNDLADLATRPNLLLVHDRYRLDPGFFAGFDKYGSDFDYLTVPQWYETGEPFPGYCAMSTTRSEFAWVAPVRLTAPGRVYPTSFVNGGLLALKTHTLRALRLNELLFWGQAEDVEFGRWMADHSLPPRLNPHSRATVLGYTPAHTATFITETMEALPPPRRRWWRG